MPRRTVPDFAERGTKHPAERPMSVAVLTKAAITIERKRKAHGSVEAARSELARQIGVAPGTLANAAKNRLKRGLDELRARIARYVVEDIERRMEELAHQRQTFAQMGLAPTAPVVAKAEALKRDLDQLLCEIAGS